MRMTRREFLKAGGAASSAGGLWWLSGRRATAQAGATSVAAGPPNIVVILTDDQDTGTLDATMAEDGQTVPVMRHLLSGRGGGWVRFDQAYCNQAICAPSRASLITGRYAHHHGVERNGLIGRMVDRDHTLARWLSGGGYFCAFKGKYSYGRADGDIPKPAGWDVWEPGGGYSSAVFPRGAQLIRQVAATTPIFLCLWPVDPHEKAKPQPAYSTRPITLPADNPSVNEADVSDKPARIRKLPLLRPGQLAGLREKRRQACRALAGVDDGVKLILDTLEETGRLENTVIVFAGDHGYLWGEHRLSRKDSPYRPATGFPLLIRDPYLAGNETRREWRMVSNVDLAVTLAEYAGVTPDVAVDGRSLVGVIRSIPAAGWDERVLIEKNTSTSLDPTTYRGVYATVGGAPWSYVRYDTGEEELYDLAADPDQMESLHGRPEYAAVREALAGQAAALGGTP